MQPIFDSSSLFLQIGNYLEQVIELLGPLTYLILFLLIFIETGFVITYFLPGDSLIFLVGTLTGTGRLNFFISFIVLVSAAILGDSLNYWFGSKIGPKVFSKDNSKVFKKKYLARTHDYFEKYGSKTIIIARFVPMLRTFAPFTAGIGKMKYKTFLTYNIIGAFIWVSVLMLLGHFFGTQPIVKDNFEIFLFIIFALFFVLFLIQYLRKRKEPKMDNAPKTNYDEIKEVFED